MNPGRWAMAIAKRHRAALVAAGVGEQPPMIDVTVSLLIAARGSLQLDLQSLMSMADRDLIAEVGHIHQRIDRATGELRDLFATHPQGDPDEAKAASNPPQA